MKSSPLPALALFALFLLVPILPACSIATQSQAAGDVPDSASFLGNGVSRFMERRCGSLDCHGQPGRPLRIYSDWGLRLKSNEDGTRDTSATTTEEQMMNYQAVVGLEPERLAILFAGGTFDNFQLLLKPLDISGGGIRHKGGPVIRRSTNDPGWACLSGWASGAPRKDQCEEAAKLN